MGKKIALINPQLEQKENHTWTPKPLLRAARKEHMGHYRRVSQQVWELWSTSYAGSGPAIVVVRIMLFLRSMQFKVKRWSSTSLEHERGGGGGGEGTMKDKKEGNL